MHVQHYFSTDFCPFLISVRLPNVGMYTNAHVAHSVQVPVGGACKHSHKDVDFIKGKGIFDKVRNYQFLKEDSSLCTCYVPARLLVQGTRIALLC